MNIIIISYQKLFQECRGKEYHPLLGNLRFSQSHNSQFPVELQSSTVSNLTTSHQSLWRDGKFYWHDPLLFLILQNKMDILWVNCIVKLFDMKCASLNDLTSGCQTSDSASSSKFHHFALLVAPVSHSSNFHHWPLLALLVALLLH